jgi:hypothetical protein
MRAQNRMTKDKNTTGLAKRLVRFIPYSLLGPARLRCAAGIH